jgi:acyl-CoA synthetase (AMP-forming)/AMP-acid ligase II
MQLIDLFDRGAGYGLAAPCLIEPGGRTLSYGEVQDLTHRIANGLKAAGVARQSKVGLLAANHLLTFVAIATRRRRTSTSWHAAAASSCSSTALSRRSCRCCARRFPA